MADAPRNGTDAAAGRADRVEHEANCHRLAAPFGERKAEDLVGGDLEV